MAFLSPISGAPSDSLGSDGDIVFDYTNKFYYGPKGSVTAGSWTGTAFNAQGPSGPPPVYGVGAPSSAQGQIGQAYIDLTAGATWGPKTASGWGNVAVGQIAGAAGAAGQRGATVLTGTGAFVAANYPNAQAGDIYIDQTPGVNAAYILVAS